MKSECPNCNRNVGVTKTKPHRLVKHRIGRSTKKNVQPVCKGTNGSLLIANDNAMW